MLQQMRNPRTLKWLLWAVIILVVPSFVLFYGNFGSQPVGGPAVQIDDYVTVADRTLGREDMIFARDRLANQYAEMYQRINGQPANPQLIASALSNKDIAEYAASLVAFDKLAEEHDVYVSPTQVQTFLQEFDITRPQFEQMLAASGRTEAQWVGEMMAQMQNERARRVVGRYARVSLPELWNEYRLNNERARLEYVKILPSEFTDDEDVEPTEEQIQEYYEENRERYVKPEERVYRYVLLTPPPAEPVQVTEEMIEQAYDAIDWETETQYLQEPGRQIRQIMLTVDEEETAEEVRAEAEELLQRVRNGESLAILANEFTEDPSNRRTTPSGASIPQGGLLQTRLNEDTLEDFIAEYGEPWAETMFGLMEDELSGVIESDGRFFIAQVEGVFEERPSLDQLRNTLRSDIREELTQEQAAAREEAQNETEIRMREVVAANTSMEGIASTLDAEVRVTSPTVTGAFSISPIGSVFNHMEIIEDLQEGQISPVMRTSERDNLFVLQVAEVLPEGQQTLDEVRESVTSAVRRVNAAEKARRIADEITDKVAAGTTLREAAQEYGLETVEMPEPFVLSQVPQELSRARASLRNRIFRTEEGGIGVAEAGTGEFTSEVIVFEVEEKIEPDRAAFMEELKDLEIALSDSKNVAFIEEYREDALEQLQPVYNPDYISEDDPRVSRRRSRRGS